MRQAVIDHLPQNHPWAELLQVHEVLDSTNTHAKALAKQGAPEGTVVIAQQQTAGRGRLGRSFYSPGDGGLYFSVILRPGCLPAELMHLTCAVAVAACDAVEKATGLRPGIKWINDLTLGGKKLGGILTELGLTPDAVVDYAIVGIGINCTQVGFPEELKPIACSIAEMGGNAPDIPLLASALMVELEKTNSVLLSRQKEIIDRYRRDCVTLGKRIRVISPTDERKAEALDVAYDGSLLVRFDDGCTQTVNCGEVSVRGLWDYV